MPVRIEIFVDRNGKEHSREVAIAMICKVYAKSTKASLMLFPDIKPKTIKNLALKYGAGRAAMLSYTEEEVAICRHLYPNLPAIIKRTGRTPRSVENKCQRLGLAPQRTNYYTTEEVSQIRSGVMPEGRSVQAVYNYYSRRGMKRDSIISARAIDPEALLKQVSDLIPRGYPAHIRADALQSVMEMCLNGACSSSPIALKATVKKAITATYKLHPDRGAPVSLDAKAFDEGTATIGDRIDSEAFRF